MHLNSSLCTSSPKKLNSLQSTCLSPCIHSHYSADKDIHDVYGEVVELAGKWSSLCLALKLLPSDQSAIVAAHPGNPHECLQTVLVKWLQKCYNYQQFGSPTWRMLVKAVSDPAGGNNNALAERIAEKHAGRGFE